MKITIFGANGQIGQHLVKQALEAGHEVIAYTRRANTIDIQHEKLQIVVGDLTDRDKLKEAIAGSDAVLSSLGPKMTMKRKVTELPIAEGHQAIISVMEKHGLKRLITLATPAFSAEEDIKQIATVLPGFMPRIFMPSAYKEMIGIKKLLETTQLDWTVVRIIDPNAKTDGNGYAISFGDTKSKMSVSRYNAAKCMLDAVSKDEWIHKMPIVFNN